MLLDAFLNFSYLILPIGIFTYTWTFLDLLLVDLEGKSRNLLLIYKYASILIVPLITYTAFIAFCIRDSQYYYTLLKPKDREKNKFYGKKNDNLYQFLLCWNFLVVITACINLGLFLRKTKKLIHRINSRYLA